MTPIAARLLSLFLLLGTASTPPAIAQSSVEEEDPSIVVTERQPLDENRALDVVRRAAQTVDGQLARFRHPICPRVTGFETKYERMVAERIKRSAEAVGVDAGGEGCLTNLQVVIVDDGREFVELLLREHPEAFSGVSKREMRRLATDEGAARSWSVTALTNSFGGTGSHPSPSSGGGTVKGQGGASVTFDGSANVMRVYDASNINPSVEQALVTSWVVIETGATFGKSLTQIADYAAMRGLAMVRPAELADSADTILALFEPDAPAAPAEMTAFDQAYLKALYHVQGRRWARQQVRQMADAIAGESRQGNP